MKKKRVLIVLILLSLIIVVLGIFLLRKNAEFDSNKIEIIDATYICDTSVEKFYEDKNYVYYFPCIKSSSVFVKFKNGNKMLVVDALNQELVNIDELLNAGLEVYKEKK